MKIKTVSDFRKAYKSGPYAWPGGYPKFFITADGGVLSWKTAKECRGEILRAIAGQDTRSGWCIVGVDINYEDENLHCDHTGENIPSAYGENN